MPDDVGPRGRFGSVPDRDGLGSLVALKLFCVLFPC